MLVPFNVFRQLRKVADRDSSRYALGGILFERSADGSPVAVATDGRRLVAFTWREPDETSAHPLNRPHPLAPVHAAAAPGWQGLISGEALAQICGWKLDKKAVARRPILGFVYVDETGAAEREPGEKEDPASVPRCLPIRATDGSASYAIENARADGRFPKWRDVFPRWAPSKDPVSITLDPCYVAELADVCRELATTDAERGIDLAQADPAGACRFDARTADGARVAAVLMPLARENEQRGKGLYTSCEFGTNPSLAHRVRRELALIAREGQSFDVETDGADWRFLRVTAPDLGIEPGAFVARDLLSALRGAPVQPLADGPDCPRAARWRERMAKLVGNARAPQAAGEPGADSLVFSCGITGAVVGRSAA
ncbi:MAG: hypothetical protein AB7O59_24520 [Pirellulales bacterium]